MAYGRSAWSLEEAGQAREGDGGEDRSPLLVQRSLGITAFRQGTPIELICRDLSTYLRQPAADAVLTESATWFADHPDASVAL